MTPAIESKSHTPSSPNGSHSTTHKSSSDGERSFRITDSSSSSSSSDHSSRQDFGITEIREDEVLEHGEKSETLGHPLPSYPTRVYSSSSRSRSFPRSSSNQMIADAGDVSLSPSSSLGDISRSSGRPRYASSASSRPQSINSLRAPSILSVTGKGIASNEACHIMADHLHSIAETKGWIAKDCNLPSCVAIRFAPNQYAVSGDNDLRLEEFRNSIKRLDSEIAFTMTCSVAQAVVDTIPDDEVSVAISRGLKVQVVDNFLELGDARRSQSACFVRDEGCLVLWGNDVRAFESTCSKWEAALINYIWTAREHKRSRHEDGTLTRRDPITYDHDEKGSIKAESWIESDNVSVAECESQPKGRSVMLYNPIYAGLAAAANMLVCSLLPMKLLRECLADGYWARMGICAVLPFFWVVLMFVCDSVVGTFAQILGPIDQMKKNSLYYSGIAPNRLTTKTLPHMTVVMPVYKEGVKAVLAPTLESIEAAIMTYELQGGTANILVCEDGMQVVNEAERAKRVAVYEQYNCGWVARHPEGRAGRFKKSSNMNVAKAMSIRVELLMDELRPQDARLLEDWTQFDEDKIYQIAFKQALDEHGGRTWGSGNIRIGDYILLIDSDTRVPADCLLDAASEMEQCPEVGILQHCSGTFLSGAGYFETGIAHFTKIVNYSISWTVANGGQSPFMGHNAFLRWSALQDQMRFNPEQKIWSEEHVSEDFVMSLNLINRGFITRWATYSDLGYLEGVSLSCDDELNRWQKYAWGCSEMVFNPVKHWLTKSPFASLYRTYLWSDAAPIHAKLGTTSYVASYWAIASGPPLTLALYILVGLWGDSLDPVNQFSFAVLLSTIVLFTFASNLGTMIGRIRSQRVSFKMGVWEHLKWTPFLAAFLSGLSYHVMTALASHVIGVNMNWSTTVKDFEVSFVGEQLDDIARRHWRMFCIFGGVLVGSAIMTTNLIPMGWQISNWVVYLPVMWTCGFHLMYPFVLNPWITLLRF